MDFIKGDILSSQLKAFKKNEINGSVYVELCSIQFGKKIKIKNDDSIFFVLDYFLFLGLFTPERINFDLTSYSKLDKNICFDYVNSMKLFLEIVDDYKNMSDVLKAMKLYHKVGSNLKESYYNRLFAYKDLLKKSLLDIINFIKINNYEIAILGV